MRKATWIQVNEFRIDDTSLKYNVLSIDEPLIPTSNITRSSVAGRNGQKISNKGYNNKQVVITLGVFGSSNEDVNLNIVELFHKIPVNQKVRLIIGDSPHKYYDAILIEADAKEGNIYNVILTFECSFCKYELWDDSKDYVIEHTGDRTVDSVEGVLVNRTSVVSCTDTELISLENTGTFETKPVIILTGSATSVTVQDNEHSLRFAGLDKEVVYIDCDEMVVYSLNNQTKTSRISGFNGSFLTLKTGLNDVVVKVVGGEVDVDFVYRNAHLV